MVEIGADGITMPHAVVLTMSMPIMIDGKIFYRTNAACARAGISRASLFRRLESSVVEDVLIDSYIEATWRYPSPNPLPQGARDYICTLPLRGGRDRERGDVKTIMKPLISHKDQRGWQLFTDNGIERFRREADRIRTLPAI